jgi:transaldolase
MGNLLEQLKSMTVVVADSGDFDAVKRFSPRDATTNPSLLLTAAKEGAYADVVRRGLDWARTDAKGGAPEEIAKLAMDRLAVSFGVAILKILPGRVSTEVDARLSYDTAGSMAKARELIGLYERAGIHRDRVLIKLTSTWEGIRAAEELEREGIHCNMTLLFGFHQAASAADAKVTLISPFVGRILDWHLKSTGRASYPAPEDPGVLSATRIYNYYKRNGFKTEVMGASFRNLGEIVELAGCDLLTISPKLMGELEAAQGTLARKLDPERAKRLGDERVRLDKAAFDRMHAEDKMASDKLKEGIEGFTKAAAELEQQLLGKVRA